MPIDYDKSYHELRLWITNMRPDCDTCLHPETLWWCDGCRLVLPHWRFNPDALPPLREVE